MKPEIDLIAFFLDGKHDEAATVELMRALYAVPGANAVQALPMDDAQSGTVYLFECADSSVGVPGLVALLEKMELLRRSTVLSRSVGEAVWRVQPPIPGATVENVAERVAQIRSRMELADRLMRPTPRNRPRK